VAADPCWADGLRPALLEWSFGDGEGPLVGLSAAGRDVTFRGRVDRIDLSPGGVRARLVDYKTGRGDAEKRQVDRGQNVQLPVYRLAAAAIEPPPAEIACEFRLVSRRGGFKRLPLGDDPRQVDASLRHALAIAVEGITEGVFPRLHAGLSCDYCDLRPGCDATKWVFEHKQGAPELAGLREFKEATRAAPV
jgi:RecB family exonuclease